MFKSATFKLTSWYLGIIVAVSLLFSIVIYSIALREITTRIGAVQTTTRWNDTDFLRIRNDQVHLAEINLILGLAVTNICIWTIGGIGSYYLARRTLQPIEEAHEAQSRFVSDASHELRTPLASMKTELEVALRDNKLTKAEAKELLASNLEEVNKLTQLSSTLLQLTKLDTSPITIEKVSIPAAVQTAVKRFGLTTKRIRIKKASLTLPSVAASRLQAEELVTILVDNALKYSPEHTPVTIEFIKQKHFIGFEISNEGEGISPKALPHIFDRFYQTERSRSHHTQKGFGIGLSLAKRIVELYHGELSVTSAPNTTTTFRVLLPKFDRSKQK